MARALRTRGFEKRDPLLTLVSERGPCAPVRKGNSQEEGGKKKPRGEEWEVADEAEAES